MACKLKFEPTRELLYQSNPTLIPMRQFDIEQYVNHHYEVVTEENEDEDDDMDGFDMNGYDEVIEPMEVSPQSPELIHNGVNGVNGQELVPYSPGMNNPSSPGQILTDYQPSNHSGMEQMTLIHVNNTTQNSNTASYKSPNTGRVNITPAPSNAPNTMQLLAKDSGYEDCEDDSMIYMHDPEQLGAIPPPSIKKRSISNSKSRSKLNSKMVTFAPNESNLVAHIEHSQQGNERKETVENSQSDGAKLNLYHTSATESEMP